MWIDFHCNVKFQMSENWGKTEKVSRESVLKMLRECISHRACLLLFFSVSKEVTSNGIIS